MNILGISCFYHDSACCLVQDGKIIAAAQEERFTRKKHDFSFPAHALAFCLKYAGISIKDVDLIVFYEKPFIKFERILEASLSYAPLGISQFVQAMPLWLKQKLWIPEIIRQKLEYTGKIAFCGHHEAHAASAFYPSPYQNAAFLTMDGVGEWETASFGTGKGNSLEINSYLRFPHSLGLLYSAFTYFCGFKVNSGEYKLMGLAPYGEPRFACLIRDKLLDLKDDGSFKLNMKYFGFGYGLRMTNSAFDKLFGMLPRKPETKITQDYMDIAASIQQVTEEIMLKMARHVRQVTGQENLCLAGGVSLNCVGNGKILRAGIFKNIWIQPASGDAGGALGAALVGWHNYSGKTRNPESVSDSQKSSLLGTEYAQEEVENFLKTQSVPYHKLDLAQIPEKTADLIINGNIIGWFQGRMEYGPRALGARSIIGDARNTQMQSKMNLKIKYRESFRPFAPTVLSEEAGKWFEMDCESPYMLLVADLKKEKRSGNPLELEKANGFDKLRIERSIVQAVTHVDYSARVQTVKRSDNPLYYDTINAFFKKTGCPVIINTSFNVRGEPLVESPQDAFRCFMRTEMDYLIIGQYLLDKKEQKQMPKDTSWQKEFELD
ncbi:MAG: carbamoyltransferase [Candidatus Omnitrophica bacterium]|jgi:carbamoyltransferase|nr:carbamoyltransferase [Candidatus Omnitrophota bacterium]